MIGSTESSPDGRDRVGRRRVLVIMPSSPVSHRGAGHRTPPSSPAPRCPAGCRCPFAVEADGHDDGSGAVSEFGMSSERVAVTRRIAAPIGALYAIVSDPAGHVRIDGSGMLETASGTGPLVAVGDTFDIAMDRTPLNDIPGLIKYSVRNTVTRLEPGRLVEWTVGAPDQPPLGHVYGWQLDPVDDNHTDVTNYCDWSNIVDELRARGRTWPIVPVEMLEASVTKLENLVTVS